MQINIDLSALKRSAEENPLLTIGVFGAALTGLAKLMNANTSRQNAKTWKKEVARRASK